jgi:hypothetical protein
MAPALAWIGRGDFEPEAWRTAAAEAKQRAEGPTWKYLLGFELLPDYLEDALPAFGRSCEGLGSADEGRQGARSEDCVRRWWEIGSVMIPSQDRSRDETSDGRRRLLAFTAITVD